MSLQVRDRESPRSSPRYQLIPHEYIGFQHGQESSSRAQNKLVSSSTFWLPLYLIKPQVAQVWELDYITTVPPKVRRLGYLLNGATTHLAQSGIYFTTGLKTQKQMRNGSMAFWRNHTTYQMQLIFIIQTNKVSTRVTIFNRKESSEAQVSELNLLSNSWWRCRSTWSSKSTSASVAASETYDVRCGAPTSLLGLHFFSNFFIQSRQLQKLPVAAKTSSCPCKQPDNELECQTVTQNCRACANGISRHQVIVIRKQLAWELGF